MVTDKHLRHMREPDTPRERGGAPSMLLMDYQALYLRRALQEREAYDNDDLAGSYADFIGQKIIELGNQHMTVYAHTDVAENALRQAVEDVSLDNECLRREMIQKIHSMEEI